jgi:hypothetical protein
VVLLKYGFVGLWFFVQQQQPQIILLKEGADTSEGKLWLTLMHVLQ